MARAANSDRELSPEELKLIAADLEVNNPIMSYRVVGSTIELRLLGGLVIQGPIDNEDLSNLSMKDLYSIAQGLKITGRSRMSRDELEEAILSYGS